MKKIFYVMLLGLLVGACQDHHFVPIDKADKITLPKPAASAGKGFKKSEAPKKFVMTNEWKGDRKPEADGKIIAEGSVQLGDKITGRDFSGYTVYVIAWDADKPGPPVAVLKKTSFSFPMSFSLGEEHLMLGRFPTAETRLLIEARLDADGDVMTKKHGDYYGVLSSEVPVGATGVSVLMDKGREG